MVSFIVIKQAMMLSADVQALLRNVILSGNASIDHAFCLVGLVANNIYHDTRTRPYGRRGSSSHREAGQEITVWDLEAEIDSARGAQTGGVVMDAYLGDLQRKTPPALLRKIRRKERTHYLGFQKQYPIQGVDHNAPAGSDLLPDI